MAQIITVISIELFSLESSFECILSLELDLSGRQSKDYLCSIMKAYLRSKGLLQYYTARNWEVL